MKRFIVFFAFVLTALIGYGQSWISFDTEAQAKQFVQDVFNMQPEPPETVIVALPKGEDCHDIYYAIPPESGIGPVQYVYQHTVCEYSWWRGTAGGWKISRFW